MSELLKVERLDVHYGGIQAVRDVSFTLREGEQATLIGANGAGKSSTVRAITGLESFSGSIEFNGKAVRKHRPETLLRDGLVMVPEGRGIFSRMTVLENLQMGAWLRRDTVTVKQEMNAIFERFPRLGERQHQLAGLLSGGEQQLLALNRALLSRPRLLILDEPAAGMNAAEKVALGELLTRIRDDGKTLLMIEHDVKLVMGICDRLTVLDYGKTLASGTPENVRRDPAVIAAWLGGNAHV